MKFEADLFPYPVLNTELDDYVGSSFQAQYRMTQETQTQLSMTVSYQLDDPLLLRLIEEGKAVYAVHLEGEASSFRELHTTSRRQQEVKLNVENLSRKIQLNFFVMAATEILNYTNPSFNPLYYPEDFSVAKLNKSDILAYQNVPDLQIEFENKLMRNQESMIWVTSIDQQYMSVDIDGDTIEVRLPEKAYDAYYNLSQLNKVHEDLLLSALILPALTYTLEQIKTGGYYANLRWFDSLNGLLGQLTYSLSDIQNMDSMKVAQQLLDYPLEASLVNFYEWEEKKDDR